MSCAGLRSPSVFFFNDTATTEIYTLSLHDALPIYSARAKRVSASRPCSGKSASPIRADSRRSSSRSEEHTSELQSPDHLVCRLLLEKQKRPNTNRACEGEHSRLIPRPTATPGSALP